MNTPMLEPSRGVVRFHGCDIQQRLFGFRRKVGYVPNDSVSRLRDLMALDSLEAVFSELVFREDPDLIARDIADVAADSVAGRR